MIFWSNPLMFTVTQPTSLRGYCHFYLHFWVTSLSNKGCLWMRTKSQQWGTCLNLNQWMIYSNFLDSLISILDSFEIKIASLHLHPAYCRPSFLRIRQALASFREAMKIKSILSPLHDTEVLCSAVERMFLKFTLEDCECWQNDKT